MTPSAEADAELVAHMLNCIERTREYTQEQRTVFFGSRLIQDAVIRNLHMLTESSQRLSDGLKAREPGIDWRRMAGMRNILVHDYLGGIDLETVWVVVERSLPPLELALQRQRSRLSRQRNAGRGDP